MIPRVAQRGQSFKGAGAYYLHDKQASTNERVAWTYTHNLPTMDAEKGFRYMAYTAKNAEYLKHNSQEVSSVGRKSTAGSVYSFSLSWHPEQTPHKSTMQNEALKTLAALGLAEHEAVIIAHNDEPHPHVHVVCNLVHPETGRTAVVSYDYLTTSRLAQERERKDGKIYCEQRVANNEKRRTEAKENRQLALVKHKERKLEMASQIQELYATSDSGKAFQSALQDAGYTLAQGDRRGFVLVDNDGEIFSLSRQLKGQRAKDIKDRLANLDNLPMAEELSENRKYFMRDQHETDLQKRIVDDAIEQHKDSYVSTATGTSKPPVAKTESLKGYKSFAEELDKKRDEEFRQSYQWLKKKTELKAYYNKPSLEKRLSELQKTSEQTKLQSKRNQLELEMEQVQKSIENIEMRLKEQGIEPKTVKLKHTDSEAKLNDKYPNEPNNQPNRDDDSIPSLE